MKSLLLPFYSYVLFWAELGLFVLLNILDGRSTYIVMQPDHFERERNPIARWVLRKLGVLKGIFIFKTVLLAVLIPAMCFYAAYEILTINIVLLVANLVFALVVLNNYRVYKKVKLWERQ